MRHSGKRLVAFGGVALIVACGARSGLEPAQVLADGGTGFEAGTGGAPPGGHSSASGSASGGTAGKAASGNSSGGFPTAGMPGAPQGGSAQGGAPEDGGAGGERTVPSCPDDAVELCNGLDDDCDGEIDEDLPLEVTLGPVEVRTDQGSAVPDVIGCVSCNWAWYPQFIEPNEQLAVVWYLGLYGGHEKPTGFGRKLSWDLAPESDVLSLGPHYWMSTLRSGQTSKRGTLLTFVERTGHDDVPSFGFVNSQLEQSESVALDGCAGQGYGFGTTPLFSGLVGCSGAQSVRLFAVDAQGKLGARHVLEPKSAQGQPVTVGGSLMVAAFGGERGLVALPFVPGPSGTPSRLWTQPISADGTPLGNALDQELDLPKYLTMEGLFATPTGYLLFAHDFGFGDWPSGRLVAPLDRDGKLSGPIEHYDQGKLKSFDEVVVTRVGSGFVSVLATEAGLLIEQLDGAGKLLKLIDHGQLPYSRPALRYSHGHLYVAFVEEPEFTDPNVSVPNRVLVSRFSCQR